MYTRKKILIFIVTYKAEDFIESVLARIPTSIFENIGFDTEILLIDDESGDETFYRAQKYASQFKNKKMTVLHNPVNQGYGGNQKIGYHYAIKNNFDAVVLLHGDGQYPPELIEQMVTPILIGETDVVFGSRMMNKGAALRGRMPLYKWIGNQILTFMQNKILNTHLAEFHTGYRAYSVEALKSIPFDCNSNYYDFDTDIVIQLLDTQKRILEIPIPTFYGQEISRVNGFKYGALILKTSILSRIIRLGIFYDPKFDYTSENAQYVSKVGYDSSHQFALDRVFPDSTVLDLGSGPGIMVKELIKNQIQVISVDKFINSDVIQYSKQAIEADIEQYKFESCPEEIDFILMLDIIEHLREPELILHRIRERYGQKAPTIILTTGNIAFLPLRLALLFGQFNYGKRGILDLSHTRLFTFGSLLRLLNNSGFEVIEVKGLPVPFYLALANISVARFLISINQLLIRISKTIFSYQIAVVIKPLPTIDMLLEKAIQSGQEKADGKGNV